MLHACDVHASLTNINIIVEKNNCDSRKNISDNVGIYLIVDNGDGEMYCCLDYPGPKMRFPTWSVSKM